MVRRKSIDKYLDELRREEEERERQEHARVKSLMKQVKKMIPPKDWRNPYIDDERAKGIYAQSPQDGLLLSLSNLGRVDIEYIAYVTNDNLKNVITSLRGSIYQDPLSWGECFYKGWQTADEYLSGNLFNKLVSAYSANDKYMGYFISNINALMTLTPDPMEPEDIYVTLGSPWVPEQIINDFIVYLFADYWDLVSIGHFAYSGAWKIYNKSYLNGTVEAEQTYGTKRIPALTLLERTLNMRPIRVYDEVRDPNSKSGTKRVINRSETMLALEKQELLIKEFQSWIWEDEDRKKYLSELYTSKYGCIKKRTYDGSFLAFPNMSKDINLYQYQKNAVARIIFNKNTLLAHDVGSGKTYIMIAAAMELKRMGLSSKNLFVVPNNIVGQWKNVFLELYPDANVRVIEPKGFVPSKRQQALEDIRDNEYDGIIMAYSCFERIPLSIEEQYKALRAELVKVHDAALNDIDKKYAVTLRDAPSKLEGKIRTQISKVMDKTPPQGVTFETLGVTRLFVDEAHNFKNVPFQTQVGNVLGINPNGSRRCQDVMDKVKSVQRANNGGGVVFATGTPITNSITDAYIMQRYLQEEDLISLELNNFDSWIGMFAQKTTGFEIDVDTTTYRLATRFSNFHNLEELSSTLFSVADFHQLDNSADIPDFNGYSDVLIPKSEELSQYLTLISMRADQVREHEVNRAEDNMLKITTDGRKAALDMRLVDSRVPRLEKSKVVECAKNVIRIYNYGSKTKRTQLVFCDTSIPKQSFNLYDELKTLLVEAKIPDGEIAYIHDATNEKKREEIYLAMREGRIRVLIGSTFKLGLGVNVQDKLIALHHLDVPWRPADMTQREGRILRQGNTNKEVQIYRYITEGSFDAYSWQLLETKQKFISDLLSGSLSMRSGQEIENCVLDYAEVKALAIGNPLIKKRVEKANEISRLKALAKKEKEEKVRMRVDLEGLPYRRERLEKRLSACNDDLEFYKANKVVLPKEKRQEIRKMLDSKLRENEYSNVEVKIFVYQGFNVIVPSSMSLNRPYVWLERRERYSVDLGESEKGNLIRLDNHLDSLEQYVKKIQSSIEELDVRKASLERELSQDKGYTSMVEQLKEELKDIDKQLGVGVMG